MWGAVVVRVDEALGEQLVAGLGRGILGTEFRPAPGVLRIYLPTPRAARAAAARVVSELALRDLDPRACHVRVESVADGRWAERYQERLAPLPIGRRFLVEPGGRRTPCRGRLVIRLVPGRAFGTGEHSTTRMCAAELERHVVAGSRWVDLGCGSGILSVVACRCGARQVLALDLDPEAVEVARGVLRANRVARRVRLLRGSATRAAARVWDGVVANISSAYFLEQASAVARLLRPGGVLIASGLTAAETAPAARALRAAGLFEVRRARREGWGLLVCRSSDGPG